MDPNEPPDAHPCDADHAQAKARLTVALVGNPNTGKTTIFNNLTGARQHVGNYPGVTVELKEGVRVHGGRRLKIVDLPGTYSLTAYSEDELVARDFVIDAHPDVIVHVVDASNLERNLYLAVQLLELGVPLVVALNMSDVAAERGYAIDLGKLSALLGDVPLVRTVGHRNEGTEDLLDAVVAVGTGVHPVRRVPVSHGREVDEEVAKLAGLLEADAPLLAPRETPWIALKLLEGDGRVRQRVQERCAQGAAVLAAAEASVRHLEGLFGDGPEVVIADRRYGFISGACQEAVRRTIESRHEMSDRVDAILTHPVLGLPIFLGLMYAVFWATFRLGEWPMRGIEMGFKHLGALVAGLWAPGASSAIKSLLVDGVIGGVGGVVVFLPSILILFLAIAVLEDSGYMARAAFIMDRWMHKIGLHGKSFIPMLIGFGCTVPAIMATRVLESRRDRLVTMLILPLMSCGARLTIYAMLIPAFFPAAWRGPVLWCIYLVGIVAAVALAKVLRLTLFRGEATPFVMELPPYRMPTLRSLLIHAWDRGWLYLRKAGTLILAVSVCMWALTSYPKPPADAAAGVSEGARRAAELEYSVAGRLGQALEPVMRPLGFDWRINTALVGAFAAKEVFVAQMGIVFSLGGEETADGGESLDPLRRRLSETYTPLQGLSIMLFCLLGFPCMATVAVMRSESGTWRWALLQWAGLAVLAYGVSLAVYQAGLGLGLGGG
ncbi:MAG: ferrous iron transport protein B [Phycisphaerae bacterium]